MLLEVGKALSGIGVFTLMHSLGGGGTPTPARDGGGGRKGTTGAQAAASWAGGKGWGQLSRAIKGVSHTFRDADTRNVLERRKARSPSHPTPAQQSSFFLRHPGSRGRCAPVSGRGLIAAPGGGWNTVQHGTKQTCPNCGGRSSPCGGVGGAQSTSLRGDHVPGACLRLNLHLRAAGKQEPPDASHPARPRRRSRGCPSPRPPPTRQQSALPAGGPAQVGAAPGSVRVSHWARPFRVHVCSCVPSACVGLCTRV